MECHLLRIVLTMASAHVNVSADGSDKNDGWVSIAGKAK